MNGKDVRIGVSLLVFKLNGMVDLLRILKLQVENYPYLCIAGKNL